MPEGDSIFHLAARLRRVLEGRQIVAAQSEVVEVDEKLLVGATVNEVTSRGKNLLIAFSTGTTLHVHLLMHGRVVAYPRRDTPRKNRTPGLRLSFSTDEVEVVCIDTQILRLLRSDRIERDPKLTRIGPDPLASGSFDAAAVVEALVARPDRELGVALLDQSAMAGVGNVLKSEAMFCSGADPFALVSLYSGNMLRAVVEVAAAQLRNTTDPRVARATGRHGRITRFTEGSLRGRGSPLWVYSRSGKECFVCGDNVRMKEQGAPSPRSTYWCPSCQPRRASIEQALQAPPGVMPRFGAKP